MTNAVQCSNWVGPRTAGINRGSPITRTTQKEPRGSPSTQHSNIARGLFKHATAQAPASHTQVPQLREWGLQTSIIVSQEILDQITLVLQGCSSTAPKATGCRYTVIQIIERKEVNQEWLCCWHVFSAPPWLCCYYGPGLSAQQVLWGAGRAEGGPATNPVNSLHDTVRMLSSKHLIKQLLHCHHKNEIC